MAKAVTGSVSIPLADNGPASSLMHLSGPYGRNSVLLKSSAEEFARGTSMSAGVVGDATRATAEKGALIFEAVVTNSCAFIESIRHKTVSVRDVMTPI